jgi:hypothetical protein
VCDSMSSTTCVKSDASIWACGTASIGSPSYAAQPLLQHRVCAICVVVRDTGGSGGGLAFSLLSYGPLILTTVMATNVTCSKNMLTSSEAAYAMHCARLVNGLCMWLRHQCYSIVFRILPFAFLAGCKHGPTGNTAYCGLIAA